MKNKIILINCSNLKAGGGLQVATSFIFDIINHKWFNETSLEIWVSTPVLKNLNSLNVQVNKYSFIKEYNANIYSLFSINNIYLLSKFKIVFNVFGPSYVFFHKSINISGFAQPHLIYKSYSLRLSFLKNIFNSLKRSVQLYFFMKSDYLVTETNVVKSLFSKKHCFDSRKIQVIPNCISDIFLDKSIWKEISFIPNRNSVTLGYLGRSYPHKFLHILPDLKNILFEKYSMRAEIIVTLTKNEFNNFDNHFKSNITNIGSLMINECPSFYNKMDGIIFPSQLECFSATPVESMFMRKPIFLADKPFNRELCLDHAIYCDFFNLDNAAKVIASYYSNPTLNFDHVHHHSLKYTNSFRRSLSYMNLLRQHLSLSSKN